MLVCVFRKTDAVFRFQLVGNSMVVPALRKCWGAMFAASRTALIDHKLTLNLQQLLRSKQLHMHVIAVLLLL
jgi:hypothetical protein